MTLQLNVHSANILCNAKYDMPSSDRGPLANNIMEPVYLTMKQQLQATRKVVSMLLQAHSPNHHDLHQSPWLYKVTSLNMTLFPLVSPPIVHISLIMSHKLPFLLPLKNH